MRLVSSLCQVWSYKNLPFITGFSEKPCVIVLYEKGNSLPVFELHLDIHLQYQKFFKTNDKNETQLLTIKIKNYENNKENFNRRRRH